MGCLTCSLGYVYCTKGSVSHIFFISADLYRDVGLPFLMTS